VALNLAASSYERAYDRFRKVIDAAGRQAASRNQLVELFVGFGVGVAVGLITGAALPASAGLGITLLGEVASELAQVSIGAVAKPLTEDGVHAVPPMNAHFPTQGLAHRSALETVHRGLVVTGRDAVSSALVLNGTTYLEGQARLMEGHAEADLSILQVLVLLDEIRGATATIDYPASSVEELRDALQARGNPPDAREMEQYLWVSWIDEHGSYDEERDEYFYRNTDDLDRDIIEDYLHGAIGVLGSGSLLGVSFGRYTSEADERRAVRAANARWSEFHDRVQAFLPRKGGITW
jgi:hypothetical protein